MKNIYKFDIHKFIFKRRNSTIFFIKWSLLSKNEETHAETKADAVFALLNINKICTISICLGVFEFFCNIWPICEFLIRLKSICI